MEGNSLYIAMVSDVLNASLQTKSHLANFQTRDEWRNFSDTLLQVLNLRKQLEEKQREKWDKEIDPSKIREPNAILKIGMSTTLEIQFSATIAMLQRLFAACPKQTTPDIPDDAYEQTRNRIRQANETAPCISANV